MAPQKQNSSSSSVSVASANVQPSRPPPVIAANGTPSKSQKPTQDSLFAASKMSAAQKSTASAPLHSPVPQDQALSLSQGATSAQSSPGSVCNRPLAEIITETFPSFDHQRLVVGPFSEDAAKDAKFEQGKPRFDRAYMGLIDPAQYRSCCYAP
ncbi:hypothetical protein D9757_004142 [Collybiopsis confluens]|uniref:Uncharacterized protein n=1 Tax=Collybiopsis confluens TaxID=2823264 RepID=A0A8H5MDD7_9AGAR|nr:hypothetical protein D9757_004142 [Collybiopsis confluens]